LTRVLIYFTFSNCSDITPLIKKTRFYSRNKHVQCAIPMHPVSYMYILYKCSLSSFLNLLEFVTKRLRNLKLKMIQVFSGIGPCRLLIGYRRFEGYWYLRNVGNFLLNDMRVIPDDLNVQQHRCQNTKLLVVTCSVTRLQTFRCYCCFACDRI
jgi:hypothetical protein